VFRIFCDWCISCSFIKYLTAESVNTGNCSYLAVKSLQNCFLLIGIFNSTFWILYLVACVLRAILWWLGTVDNHGNTKITEAVIFVKCHECRDFAKMPCFCRVFCQNAIVLRFHKNILFLSSIILSSLCEFNTKLFTFPLPLLPKSVCFVT